MSGDAHQDSDDPGRQAAQLVNRLAAERDVAALVENLYATGFLEGLVSQLAGHWRDSLPNRIDHHHFVGLAVDALCAAIDDGQRVYDVHAFLWVVANRRANDEHGRRRRERATDPARLDARPQPEAAPGGRRALAIARGLLPRLGGENAQRVMGYLFDAIEAGRDFVPNAEIAEALGLTVDNAKQLKKRGFDRLARVAKQEGLVDQRFDVRQLGDLAEDETDDTEEDSQEGGSDAAAGS